MNVNSNACWPRESQVKAQTSLVQREERVLFFFFFFFELFLNDPRFLEIARKDAAKRGQDKQYSQQGDLNP